MIDYIQDYDDWIEFRDEVAECRLRNPDWSVQDTANYTGGSVEDVVDAINEIEGELV